MFTDKEKSAALRLIDAAREFNLAAKAARTAGLHYETTDLTQSTFEGNTAEIEVTISKYIPFDEGAT